MPRGVSTPKGGGRAGGAHERLGAGGWGAEFNVACGHVGGASVELLLDSRSWTPFQRAVVEERLLEAVDRLRASMAGHGREPRPTFLYVFAMRDPSKPCELVAGDPRRLAVIL